ncbi:MAG: T9SS type A sorting domain-containing protein [Flavobacteriales bacterium]|nr:T9SS type A sorting domain-containing protein [Flavobacteriales bacterium]
MKKSLLITLLFTSSLTVLAQQSPCVPDASLQDSTFGLWPDTIQNLPIAQLDTYYEEHIQIKTPATVGEVMGDPYEIDVLGFPVNIAPLEIDSIKLVGVTGLPSSMSTYLSNSDSVFMGNDIACVTLFGTPGEDELGTHELSLIIDGWINVSVIGTVSLYEQLGDYENIDGYRLVVESEMVSINENDKVSFSVSQNSPNPFSNRTSIEFNSTSEGEYLFSVVNLLGEVQDHRIINANYGSNKIDVDASALSSGIYFYTLSNAQGMITKKMIINKN